jgi:thioredoxin 1
MEQITTQQLKQKISNGENFILDLYGVWCGPCKIMLNNLNIVNESLIKENSTKKTYKIYKYDIDSDREFVIEKLGIRSVPTIKIFKEGKEVFSKTGVMTPSEVIGLLN